MSLAAYHIQVADAAGNVVPGAHVEIRSEVPGQPLVAVYSDRSGAAEYSLGNPFDVDAVTGYKTVYLVGGSYQVRIYTGASGSPTFEAPIRRHIAVGLNSESDSIAQRTKRTVTAAGAVAISADDAEDIIINKTVGAATTVNLPDAALRTKSVRIIDGKGDAATNNITILPEAGQTIHTIVDYPKLIDGNGWSTLLTPLADGTGWY
jgi:hypothetical protein